MTTETFKNRIKHLKNMGRTDIIEQEKKALEFNINQRQKIPALQHRAENLQKRLNALKEVIGETKNSGKNEKTKKSE